MVSVFSFFATRVSDMFVFLLRDCFLLSFSRVYIPSNDQQSLLVEMKNAIERGTVG